MLPAVHFVPASDKAAPAAMTEIPSGKAIALGHDRAMPFWRPGPIVFQPRTYRSAPQSSIAATRDRAWHG
jgi:hypothetical protein